MSGSNGSGAQPRGDAQPLSGAAEVHSQGICSASRATATHGAEEQQQERLLWRFALLEVAGSHVMALCCGGKGGDSNRMGD